MNELQLHKMIRTVGYGAPDHKDDTGANKLTILSSTGWRIKILLT